MIHQPTLLENLKEHLKEEELVFQVKFSQKITQPNTAKKYSQCTMVHRSARFPCILAKQFKLKITARLLGNKCTTVTEPD